MVPEFMSLGQNSLSDAGVVLDRTADYEERGRHLVFRQDGEHGVRVGRDRPVVERQGHD
jgi:hypothetical protein